jgi:hypothetical protein
VNEDQRTPEGRLLRRAVGTMESGLLQSGKNHAEILVRASQDGSVLGEASWSRTDGWVMKAEVMTNLKKRGGGYASLSVTRSW